MKCFVIMPFGNPKEDSDHARKLEFLYSEWLKPTVEAIKCSDTETIKCHRADQDLRPEEIITHIIENLVTSDIVIADLSGRNPNVFYELGVRHAVNNSTILIAEDLDDIPFDLRGLRTIVYSYDIERMVKLKKSLEQAIGEILNEPDKIDNPVRRFLYEQEVDKLIKQPTPPGYDVFKSIISEVASLRTEVTSHVNEVRHIMKLITSSERASAGIDVSKSRDLEFFEGIWEVETSGSTYCARVVDGELFMPYCYHGDKELTGHYYNLKLIGETLFGRFRWFKTEHIFGYTFLKAESEDKLVGGWWSGSDLPREIFNDISMMNSSIPDMVETILERDSKRKRFPSWAEEYFRKGLYKG
ncbi:MAG: hypothetical protein H7Z16_06905 [Pyrinomonadaceae bacterium]|nr:hypothetical protein [Pyrinomonadaceae bacterium]